MLKGWRKFGEEMPTKVYAKAYMGGEYGMLTHHDKGWILNITIHGQRGSFTPNFIKSLTDKDIYFMEDSKTLDIS